VKPSSEADENPHLHVPQAKILLSIKPVPSIQFWVNATTRKGASLPGCVGE
jgi:hypothetical protein